MDKKQKESIDEHLSELIEVLSEPTVIGNLFVTLERKRVINRANREILEKLDLSDDKIMRLLGSLKHNDQGWSALIYFIINGCGNRGLANRLNKSAGISVAAGSESVAGQVGSIAGVDPDELHRRQNAVLQKNVDGLCAALHPDLIIAHLRKKQLINGPTAQIVKGEVDDESRIISLLDRLAMNPKFFDAIIDFLNKNGSTLLRNKLMKDLQDFVE